MTGGGAPVIDVDARLHVLDEDEDLLVVDKPAGLVCHPTKHGEASSVIGRIRLYLGHANGRLVNRLDRETSGIVLVAKGADRARDLGRLFESGQVAKRYTAIVHGHLLAPLTIDAPLGDDEASPVAIKNCVRDDGAQAVTDVSPIARCLYDGAAFSVVDVAPRTGRKHQIRIHLAHAGHPIVGDKLYGADEQRYLRLVRGELSDADRHALILPTHALHAGGLAITWRGQPRVWVASEPSMFSEFLAQARSA